MCFSVRLFCFSVFFFFNVVKPDIALLSTLCQSLADTGYIPIPSYLVLLGFRARLSSMTYEFEVSG